MAFGNTLFGLPLAFWGIGCLAVAVAYYRIWPVPSPKRTQPRTPWQHFVLRYSHSLVWVLLAAGCFLAGTGYANFGLWLAAAALPLYIVFLVMLVQDRNRELADLAAQRKALQGKATPSAAGQARSVAGSSRAEPGSTGSSDAGNAEIERPTSSVSQ
jgi:cytochrome b561